MARSARGDERNSPGLGFEQTWAAGSLERGRLIAIPRMEQAVQALELRPSSVDRKFSSLLQDAVINDAGLKQVHAGDLDDGLPGGFLAGAIVEVWLALHLNWA